MFRGVSVVRFLDGTVAPYRYAISHNTMEWMGRQRLGNETKQHEMRIVEGENEGGILEKEVCNMLSEE